MLRNSRHYITESKQRGFGTVAVLAILVVFGIVGYAGWYVVKRGDTETQQIASSNQDGAKSDFKTKQTTDSGVENPYKTYSNQKPEYSVDYPKDWRIEADLQKPEGYDESKVFLSPGYHKDADTSDKIGRVMAGGTFTVQIHATNIKDTAAYKQQFNGPGSYTIDMKDISLAGYPAVLDEKCGHPTVVAICAYMATNNKAYHLTYTFAQNETPSSAPFRQEFNKFIESFKLVDRSN